MTLLLLSSKEILFLALSQEYKYSIIYNSATVDTWRAVNNKSENMDWFKMNIILFHMTLLFSNGSFAPITKEEVQSLLQNFQENFFQEWENKLGKSSLKQSLLCQVPVIKTGKNFVTFLYGNFLSDSS